MKRLPLVLGLLITLAAFFAPVLTPTPANATCVIDPTLTICTSGIIRNDACPVASNTLVWCPLGDLSLITLTVQVFDTSALPCPGCPVTVEFRFLGDPDLPGCDLFICGATAPGFLTLSGITDAAGEVTFTVTGGGCGCLEMNWLAFAGGTIICQGADRFCVKSPDMTGDGTVNFLDTFKYLPQLFTAQGYCGDLNCDNTVNFFDTFTYLPHLFGAHSCPGDNVVPTTCTPPVCF